jgi:hypothetical protein
VIGQGDAIMRGSKRVCRVVQRSGASLEMNATSCECWRACHVFAFGKALFLQKCSGRLFVALLC